MIEDFGGYFSGEQGFIVKGRTNMSATAKQSLSYQNEYVCAVFKKTMKTVFLLYPIFKEREGLLRSFGIKLCVELLDIPVRKTQFRK